MASILRTSYDVLTWPLAELALRFWLRRAEPLPDEARGPRHERPAGPTAADLEPEVYDAVYTWVDSSDPEWRSRQQARLAELGAEAGDASDEQYLDREELRYSLRSLELYAPWIRRIWLVTDRQVPAWLDIANPRITIVDHEQVFPDPSALPVFNSQAIETCLHRINGLSDRFLYLNDDVFLGRPVTPADFLTPDGRLRARARNSRGAHSSFTASLPFMSANRRSFELVQQCHGPVDFGPMLDHVPHMLDRDLMWDVEKLWPVVGETRGIPFRSQQDVAPVMLTLLQAVATGRAVNERLGPLQSLHVVVGKRDLGLRLLWVWTMRPRFYCLNSTKDDDLDVGTQSRVVRGFLDTVLSEPSLFERDA